MPGFTVTPIASGSLRFETMRKDYVEAVGARPDAAAATVAGSRSTGGPRSAIAIWDFQPLSHLRVG